MKTIPILVVKDTLGELYQMRMDRPYERYLSQLLTNLAGINPQESPRELASIWIEEMTEEAYKSIKACTVISNKAPNFVTSNNTKGP